MAKTYYIVQAGSDRAAVALDGPDMTDDAAGLILDRLGIPRDGRPAGFSATYDAARLRGLGFDPDAITVPDAYAGGGRFYRDPGRTSAPVELVRTDTMDIYRLAVPSFLLASENPGGSVQVLLERIARDAFEAKLAPSCGCPEDVDYDGLLRLPAGFLRKYGVTVTASDAQVRIARFGFDKVIQAETPDPRLCPVCGGLIDEDRDIDLDGNEEDGYGWMTVDFTCPHCQSPLTAYYDAQNGYDFDHLEKN